MCERCRRRKSSAPASRRARPRFFDVWFTKLPAKFGVPRQGRKTARWIRGVNEGIVGGGNPGLGLERQSVTDGRIAGNQEAAAAAQKPRSCLPSIALRGARNRQHVANDVIQALFENLRQTRTLHGVFQPRIERIDVCRQAAFSPQVVEGVFVGRKHVLRIQPQFLRNAREEAPRRVLGHRVPGLLVGDQGRMRP
jgi:hypothetical protein